MRDFGVRFIGSGLGSATERLSDLDKGIAFSLSLITQRHELIKIMLIMLFKRGSYITLLL